VIMTPQEAKPLQDFLAQLTQVGSVEKDPEAASLIAEAIAKQPDAGYLLVQRSMLLSQALESAQATITQLQAELANRANSALSGSSRFLDPASAWGRSASVPAAGSATSSLQNSSYSSQTSSQLASQVNTQPSLAAGGQQSAQGQSPARSGFFGGGGGSFLGNIAATAAGVAGGAFLFQGIENMMGHHNGSNLSGQNGIAGTNANASENTTNNNLYEPDGSSKTSDASAQTSSSAENYEDNGMDDLGMNDDLGSADDMSSI
jgi:hypothetical protein